MPKWVVAKTFVQLVLLPPATGVTNFLTGLIFLYPCSTHRQSSQPFLGTRIGTRRYKVSHSKPGQSARNSCCRAYKPLDVYTVHLTAFHAGLCLFVHFYGDSLVIRELLVRGNFFSANYAVEFRDKYALAVVAYLGTHNHASKQMHV